MASFLLSRAFRRSAANSGNAWFILRSSIASSSSLILSRSTANIENPNLYPTPNDLLHQFALFSREIPSLCHHCSSFKSTRGVSTLSSSKKDDGDQNPESRDISASSNREPSWIDAYLPTQVRPYALLARLDKPIGTWLLAWPCIWSISLAALPGQLPDFKMMGLFGCGALLLRGAGCTVNDLLDRDIDTKIERTKLRPLASGLLTPFQGVCFLGVQLLLGLGILLQLNNYSRILGASSLLLVFSYPLMKRITFWPQAYLGLTFNWGALLGWSAVNGSLDPAIVLPLYASGVFWTLVYDTIYAHQDKDDDLKVGVKSTALRFGDSTRQWISGFGIACISSLAMSGFNADLGWPFYGFLTAASGQLAWQIWTVDLSSRDDCNKKYLYSSLGAARLHDSTCKTLLTPLSFLFISIYYSTVFYKFDCLGYRFCSNKWFGAIIFSAILSGRFWS